MAKGKNRQREIAAKQTRKAARMGKPGGKSRYAMKKVARRSIQV